jgi:deoxyribodipyrimidine photolyase-related protein
MGGPLGRGALLFGTLPTKPPARPMKIPACRTLRLVLGDQLDSAHSWFHTVEPDTLYVIAELRQEATYVRHHVQKIAAFFAAMQAFARKLEGAGHRVLHLDLDTTAEYRDLPALLAALLAGSEAKRFEYQRPDEYRLLRQLEAFSGSAAIPCRCVDSEHFLLPFGDLSSWFPSGKKHLMEHFYRRMRRELGVLVDDQGQPEGGRWNYDSENRARLPEDQPLPEPLSLHNSVEVFLERIRRHGVPVIGRMSGDTLDWPLDRDQSLALLDHFITHGLADFGRFQDAMSGRDWLLFHSRLSFSMNTKMVSPREVVDAVLGAWRAEPDRYPLASVEGFVRQVIGWREYMRGIYWAYMPEYAQRNHFGHQRPLPHYYWDGDTGMACMAHAIGQSLDHAYAHHIQRLMVTGNFALLAGIDPNAVDAWYLGIYVDAIEWVELPNTRGMSQFADGGIVASKPYSASGNYVRKMSDYCGGCRYRVNQRSGEDSCPFNSLYWHFMVRNRETLAANPRIGMIYRSWDRMDTDKRDAIMSTAEARLANIEQL